MITYNGWPLAVTGECATIDAGGHVARVRAGSVAVVLAAFARDYHREVEPIASMYGHRTEAANRDAGGDPRSDHLSGTALDINGGAHPWEKRTGTRHYPPRGGFTPAQLAALRRLQARYPVAWGGDYQVGYRDPMHHYVRGTPAQIDAAAARLAAPTPDPIATEEDDVTLTPDQAAALAAIPELVAAVGRIETKERRHDLLFLYFSTPDGRPAVAQPFSGWYAVAPARAVRDKQREVARMLGLVVEGTSVRDWSDVVGAILGQAPNGDVIIDPECFIERRDWPFYDGGNLHP